MCHRFEPQRSGILDVRTPYLTKQCLMHVVCLLPASVIIPLKVTLLNRQIIHVSVRHKTAQIRSKRKRAGVNTCVSGPEFELPKHLECWPWQRSRLHSLHSYTLQEAEKRHFSDAQGPANLGSAALNSNPASNMVDAKDLSQSLSSDLRIFHDACRHTCVFKHLQAQRLILKRDSLNLNLIAMAYCVHMIL